MAEKQLTHAKPKQQSLFPEINQDGTANKHPLAGRKQSPEHIRKRMEAVKRNWAIHGHNRVGYKFSDESKAKIGAANKGRQTALGRKLSEETKRKIGNANKGKGRPKGYKHSVTTRRKLAEMAKARGDQCNLFVDGKGKERAAKRNAEMNECEYKIWRDAVFARDNWTCQECGQRGGKLCADHIKAWSTHPELRYELSNGRTLCRECHYKTPTYGGRMQRLKKSAG